MFKASALEFRLRYLLHAVVYWLALFAPWNYWLHLDPTGMQSHIWGLLALDLARSGATGYVTASASLLALAILFALAAAALRTWGSAYLGADVVQDGAMHTTVSPTPFAGGPVRGVLTDGPFRHLRNPLYLGTFLHTFALALLMPRSGAIFAIMVIGLMQIRLILGEEAFLTRTIGAPYEAYCKLVPRIVPALRARVAAGGRRPRWVQAFIGEAYMWVVVVSFAAAGWLYNATRLLQCVLVGFGVSLVVKALTPKASPQS